jgi:hypothetical protein
VRKELQLPKQLEEQQQEYDFAITWSAEPSAKL